MQNGIKIINNSGFSFPFGNNPEHVLHRVNVVSSHGTGRATYTTHRCAPCKSTSLIGLLYMTGLKTWR